MSLTGGGRPRVEAIKRPQEECRLMFEELARTDPERARLLALHNLQSAGIVDENGNLAGV